MSAARTATRRGTTLVELLVVLAILATVTGLAGLALVKWSPVRPSTTDHIAAARRTAIATGRTVLLGVVAGSDSQHAVALPDGSVIGATLAGIDRLSGRAADATR